MGASALLSYRGDGRAPGEDDPRGMPLSLGVQIGTGLDLYDPSSSRDAHGGTPWTSTSPPIWARPRGWWKTAFTVAGPRESDRHADPPHHGRGPLGRAHQSRAPPALVPSRLGRSAPRRPLSAGWQSRRRDHWLRSTRAARSHLGVRRRGQLGPRGAL